MAGDKDFDWFKAELDRRLLTLQQQSRNTSLNIESVLREFDQSFAAELNDVAIIHAIEHYGNRPTQPYVRVRSILLSEQHKRSSRDSSKTLLYTFIAMIAGIAAALISAVALGLDLYK